MATQITPTTFDEAATALRQASAARRTVRVTGGGTKPWGLQGGAADIEISTADLDGIVEHNEGDLTAVLEAGVPLARAQRQFASAGQMLALDPDLGPGQAATLGGIIATADSGPLRHRYGAPRDLILGMTVALSDGTIARSGSKVIKNVAGYDIAKLFCGSLGTLGMILSVSVRLHPLPAQTMTTLGVTDDPEVASAAARTLTGAPLELEALDIAWRTGRGGILARCGGVEARKRAERAAGLMRDGGLHEIEISDSDTELWARQRAGQRSSDGVLLRVATRPSALAQVLRASNSAGATVVGRAAFGHCFVALEPAAQRRFSEQLPSGARTVVLDVPAAQPDVLDAWGPPPEARLLELMRGVKARFDPADVCNPGVFVGGI